MLYLIYWETKGGETDVLDTVEFIFDFHYSWMVVGDSTVSRNH